MSEVPLYGGDVLRGGVVKAGGGGGVVVELRGSGLRVQG